MRSLWASQKRPQPSSIARAADVGGIRDPNWHSDRPLPGLAGACSEAERHVPEAGLAHDPVR
ncbi:MAG: hypothetical protein OXN97_08795 [Bryobacterales bacterium]|nr:hypothetical protein [Bryobacterales bacterium]MDE0626425.1 hypothetical protein [Bryobacterales bacterium]